MKLLPKSRRGRLILAGGLLAALAGLGGYWYVSEYRPWEQPRYLGRPASWWDQQLTRQLPVRGTGPWQPPPMSPWQQWLVRLGLLRPPLPAFVRLDQPDPGAVPVLTALLASNDAGTRAEAARILGRLGPPARPALRALLPCLEDQDAKVRKEAEEAVLRVVPGAGPEALPVLTALLGSPDARTRARVAEILGHLGPPARPALLRCLEDQEAVVRRQAEEAVLRVVAGAVPEALPGLLALLASPEPRTRAAAARVLGEIGPPARRALPALLCCSEDQVAEVRRQAEDAVLRVVPAAGPERVADLTGLLAAQNARVRHEAARLLGELGEGAGPAVPALLPLLEDPDWGVRSAPFEALKRIDAGTLASRLVEWLPSPDRQRGNRASFELARLGPAAWPAVPALLRLLEQPDPVAWWRAREALKGIDRQALDDHDRDQIPVRSAQLASGDADTRLEATIRLGAPAMDQGAVAVRARRRALPAMRRALADPDDRVRHQAAHAVWNTDAEGTPELVPALIENLASADASIRRDAARDLSLLVDPNTRPAVPALLRLLAHPDGRVREAARKALQKADPDALAAYDRDHPEHRLP
jgi:HEAT repeat protein